MPEWTNAALLVLFGAHLLAFGRLTMVRRQLHYAVAATTFLLLVCVFSLRLWLPHWALAGVAVHQWLRCAAWGSAAISVALFLGRRWRRSTN
ncbi:MAG: hypothetical protein O2782_15520 [bacterium]|nr:hypothetical protein [bacterium]